MFEVATLVAEVRSLAGRLAAVEGDGVADGDDAKVDLLRALEALKCTVEATQAEVAAALDASQRAAQASAGMPASPRGQGVAAQVALARRESPRRGRLHLALALALRDELPCTRAAFRDGRVSEWRAILIARETACLSRDDRLAADRAIAGDPEALEGYSDRVVVAELRKLAARLDPASVAERRRRAEDQRCVTIRPAPDTMAYLTVLLPVAQAVACYAALKAAADTAIPGETRGRGQLMADTFVTRVSGAPLVKGRPVVPVSLGLVMTDRALFAGAHDTGHLADHGPIPAHLARELVADHLDSGTRLWLRRLYTDPTTDELVAMDSRQRRFRGRLGEFLDLRDQFCRRPWCGAPIRHRDHVVPVADGGTTDAESGQGLCEDCNYTKEAVGWSAQPVRGPTGGHTIQTTTPTGHSYRSHAPPLVDTRSPVYERADWVWVQVA